MLERLSLKELTSALNPLWANTPISPEAPVNNLENPSNEEIQALADKNSQDAIRAVFGNLYFRIPWIACPMCGKVYNQLAESGRCVACVDKQAAADLSQQVLGGYLRKTIGPYGIERYGFETFEVSSANRIAFEASQRFDPLTDNLFIYGPCGVGKTHLAGAILKGAAAKNFQCRWIHPLYLGRLLKSRFPSEEELILEDLLSAGCLIFDDLGLGRELDQTLRIIYEITDRREAQKRNGLVITSNEPLEILAKKYKDDRIISRISGLCRVVAISGPDRRLDRWENQ